MTDSFTAVLNGVIYAMLALIISEGAYDVAFHMLLFLSAVYIFLAITLRR